MWAKNVTPSIAWRKRGVEGSNALRSLSKGQFKKGPSSARPTLELAVSKAALAKLLKDGG